MYAENPLETPDIGSFFQHFFTDSCCPAFLANSSGIITWCNSALADMLTLKDFSPLFGASIRALLPTSELTRFNEEILPSALEKMWSGNINIRRMDSSTITCNMSMQNVAVSGEPCLVAQFLPEISSIESPGPSIEPIPKSQDILDICDVPLLLIGKDRKVLYYNSASEKYASEYVHMPISIGRSIYEYISSAGMISVNESLDAALSGRSSKCLMMHHDSAGEEKWFEDMYSPIPSQDGKIDAILISTDEVTGRIKAEKEIKRQAEILDHIRDAVICLNEKGFITEWTGSAYRLFGYTRDQVIDKHISYLVSGGAGISIQDLILGPASTKNNWVVELQLKTMLGTLFSGKLSISRTRDPESQRTLIVHVMDISDRLAAQKQLKESEERYRAVVESQTEIILRFKTDGHITFTNQAASAFFGITESELLSMNCSSLADSIQENDRMSLQLKALSKDIPVTSGKLRWIDSKGITRTLRYRLVAIFGSTGEVTEAQFVGTDITEVISVEENINKQRDYYENILDYTAEGIIVTNDSDAVTYVNSSALKILQKDQVNFSNSILPDSFSEQIKKKIESHYQSAKNYLTPTHYKRICAAFAPDRDVYISGWFMPLIEDTEYKGMLCFMQDDTDQVLLENEAQTQKMYLKVLNDIQTHLASEHSNIDTIQYITDLLKANIGVSGIRVFKCDVSDDDAQKIELKSIWTSPDSSQNAEYTGSYLENYFPLLKDSFYKGIPVQVNVSELSGQEQHILNNLGIKSFITVPLTTKEKPEYIICFEDYDRIRTWSDTAIIMMQTAGLVVLSGLLFKQNIEPDQVIKDFADKIPVMLWMAGFNGESAFANKRLLEFTGKKLEDQTGFGWVNVIHPDDLQRYFETYYAAYDLDTPFEIEYRILSKDGKYHWTHEIAITEYDENNNKIGYIGSSIDVTERRRLEIERENRIELLKAINTSTTREQVLEETFVLFKRLAETECVGIRLENEGDYPYFITDGFSDDFTKKTSSLYAENDQNIDISQCFCRTVISGKGSSSLPFFTEKGSFWTNSTTGLISNFPDACREIHFHECSNTEGYESAAFIPLYSNDKCFGIIQLSDHRENCFDLELISALEELANNLVNGLAQLEAKAQLECNELRYRSLVDNMNALVFHLGLDLSPIYITGKPEQLSGYPLSAYLQDSSLWKKTIHPDDIYLVEQAVFRVIRSGSPESIEFRISTAFSTTKWTKLMLNPHYDDGGLSYLDALQIDITDQVKNSKYLERHAARMAALADTSRILFSSLDYNRIIEQTVQSINSIIGCSCVLLKKCDDISNSVVIVAESGSSIDGEIGRIIDLSNNDQFREIGNDPIVRESILSIAPELAGIGSISESGPVILVPLFSADECSHILLASRQREANPFNEEDIWSATQIAIQSAAAISNAQLYQKQVTVAHAFQRNLIPSPPKTEHFDVAIFYNPVTQGIEVGGDFCDAIPLPDGKLCILIGDVSGKGLESAVQTGQAQSMIRALVMTDSSPVSVIKSLNNALCAFLSADSFVTLFYAILDAEDQTITYINAGHELPFVISPDNKTTILETTGPVLGVFEDVKHRVNTCRMDHGSTVLCYTDGVTDIKINDNWYGYDGLINSISSIRWQNPSDLIKAVSEIICDVDSVQTRDDQLLVAVMNIPVQ